MTQSEGIAGKKVVAVGCTGIVLLAAGAFAIFLNLREPYGDILAAAPVNATHVAVLREGFEERGYVHVGVWGEDGMRWSEALFGVTADHGLVVEGDRIFARAIDARGRPQLHVFGAEDGEPLWRGPFPDLREGEREPWPGPAIFVSDEVVFDLHYLEPLEVIVLDPEDGSERVRVVLETADGAGDARLVDGALLVDTGAGWRRVTSDGEARAAEAPGEATFVDGALQTRGWTVRGALEGGVVRDGLAAVWAPSGVAVFVVGEDVPRLLVDEPPVLAVERR